jgi:D-alanyl-D-alanine dipeptidase
MFLRLKTVTALVEVNKKFMKKDLKSKFFDCYRPLDIQKKCGKLFLIQNMLQIQPKVRFIIEEE